MQDLWQTRKPPTALHLADPHLAAVAQLLDGSISQADGAGPVSACRTTGLTDQHKDWSLQENVQVGLSESEAMAKDLHLAKCCIVFGNNTASWQCIVDCRYILLSAHCF